MKVIELLCFFHMKSHWVVPISSFMCFAQSNLHFSTYFLFSTCQTCFLKTNLVIVESIPITIRWRDSFYVLKAIFPSNHRHIPLFVHNQPLLLYDWILCYFTLWYVLCCRNRAKILAGVTASGAAAPAEADNPNDDTDKPEPPYSHSHLWRIVRSALPFHLVIIVIACMVWMYEPSCCDQINNLNLSRSPQLKFISGPPPI